MRDERPRQSAAGDRVHHRRLDLDVTVRIHEAANLAHHRAARQEHLAHLGVRRKVDVALAVARLDVGEPVPFLRRRQQRLAEEVDLVRLHRQLALAGAHGMAGDADEVAAVHQLERGIRGVADILLADVNLQLAVAAAKGRERRLAVRALQEDAARDPHRRTQRVQLLDGLRAEFGGHRAEAVGALEAVRIERDAERLQLRRLVEALRRLVGPAVRQLAHLHRATARALRMIASRMPFTNDGASASENRFAISTASSMITDGGVCGS